MARGQQKKINYMEAKQILTTHQFYNLMIIQKSLLVGNRWKKI